MKPVYIAIDQNNQAIEPGAHLIVAGRNMFESDPEGAADESLSYWENDDG